jgi:membrane protein YqaA with SNARE-associated domain
VSDDAGFQQQLARLARQSEEMERKVAAAKLANERADRREPWVLALPVLSAAVLGGSVGFILGPLLAGACR